MRRSATGSARRAAANGSSTRRSGPSRRAVPASSARSMHPTRSSRGRPANSSIENARSQHSGAPAHPGVEGSTPSYRRQTGCPAAGRPTYRESARQKGPPPPPLWTVDFVHTESRLPAGCALRAAQQPTMKRKLNKESTTAPTPSTAGVPSLELDLHDAADRSSVTEVRSLAELADSDDISAADGPAATWLATADATSRLPDPPTSEEAAGDPSATRSGRWSATGMPLYARAMHAHPVLDAAGERELAATIEARAADLWSALLGDEVMA